MERTAGPQWRNHCRCLKRYEHWEFATTLQLFHSHIRFLTNRMLWFALLLRLACPQALTEHQGRVKLFSFRQCLRLFSLNLWVNSWVNQFLLWGWRRYVMWTEHEFGWMDDGWWVFCPFSTGALDLGLYPALDCQGRCHGRCHGRCQGSCQGGSKAWWGP